MKQVISFFENLGFTIFENATKENPFYMNKALNQTDQIDAQGFIDSRGNVYNIGIRLIGEKYVEDYKDYEKFDEIAISRQILQWESYYK